LLVFSKSNENFPFKPKKITSKNKIRNTYTGHTKSVDLKVLYNEKRGGSKLISREPFG
jgi:hypothetical protein